MIDSHNKCHVSYLYAALNLLCAGTYALVFFWLVPSRSSIWDGVAVLICCASLLGAVGMSVPRSWGRKLAVTSSVLLVGTCLTLIVLLVASAAYLHGIYGGVGQAGTVIALVVAALAIEVFGLLPALQLAHISRTRKRGA